jgi:apolipoprotein N-acyltransferase
MQILKNLLLSSLAGFLVSSAASDNPSWFLILLGLGIWVRYINYLSLRESFYFTFVVWFVASFFLLDWLEVLGIDAKIALCAFVAVYWSCLIWIWKKLLWHSTKFQSVLFAVVVVAGEYLLSIAPFGGFNWLRLGYLLADLPTFGMTYWFGLAAISFLVSFLLYRISEPSVSKLKTLLILFVVLSVSSFGNLLGGLTESRGVDPDFDLLGIQGSVPQVGLDFNAQRAAVFANHYRKTESELIKNLQLDRNVDLIIWPENSSDIDPFRNLEISSALVGLEQKYSTPILFGAVLQQGDGLANAAVLVRDGRLNIEYQKQKLVPFGEYLPFRSILAPVIQRSDRLARDFIAGKSSATISVNSAEISVLICYEVAFDQLWHRAAKDADFIVVMTNNATYGETSQPMQQLRITQAHAKSLQIPVMVVATSGVSAFINDNGEVTEIISTNTPGAIYQQLTKPTRVAPAAYIAVPLQILATIIVLVLLLRRLWINYGLKREEPAQHHL